MRAAPVQSGRDQMGVELREGGIAMTDAPQGEADIGGEGDEVATPTTFVPAGGELLGARM
jgi:hypothetical protein